MHQQRVVLVLALFFMFVSVDAQYIYVSPKPGSEGHTRNTGIIIKTYKNLCESDFNKESIHITGTKSGVHKIRCVISKDCKTLCINTINPFAVGELVTVEIDNTNGGQSSLPDAFSFDFKIAENDINTEVKTLYNSSFNESEKNLSASDFFSINVLKDSNAAEGSVFISNFPASAAEQGFIAIIDSQGNPIYSLPVEEDTGMGFDLHECGLLSYWDSQNSCFVVMDSLFQIVDTVACRNGYTTDFHDFVIDDNGHYLLLGKDYQYVDMSLLLPGGDTNALVEAMVLQELDENKNLVFQWRSLDYLEVTDAENVNLTASYISYVHPNSVEIDNDSNLLISFRHLSEVTKINRTTGDVIWRMGGKQNMFNFVNDSVGFSFQHDARRTQTGSLTLFDNGNYHSNKVSAAKEYQIDEQNLEASLIWSYVHPDSIFTNRLGSVQRLDNGNTFICWGWVQNKDVPVVTEVNQSGEKVYEFAFSTYNVVYRAHKYLWTSSEDTNSVAEIPRSDLFENIVCYPNPTEDYCQVFTGEFVNPNREGSFVVTDISGSIVDCGVFNSDEPILIDLQNQANGLYSVVVEISGQRLCSNVLKYSQ